MVNTAQEIEVNRRPIMTIEAIVIMGLGNLLAWSVFLWTIFVADPNDEFELIFVIGIGYLLPWICLVGLFFAIIATLRKESDIQLRRIEPEIRLRRLAYIVGLLTFPLFLFAVVVIIL